MLDFSYADAQPRPWALASFACSLKIDLRELGNSEGKSVSLVYVREIDNISQ